MCKTVKIVCVCMVKHLLYILKYFPIKISKYNAAVVGLVPVKDYSA